MPKSRFFMKYNQKGAKCAFLIEFE